ncbi:MAG: hypothetical protein HQ564_03350 [Candidatus Saganbacteria bacterium]|nr:hypothetical protein [Candidatus Saganbacteria bacterium]
MKINVKRPPGFANGVFMAVRGRPKINFYNPVILNAGNIREFFLRASSVNCWLYHKFVFNRTSRLLAIAGNTDLKHRVIAQTAFVGKIEGIGAHADLVPKRDGNQIKLILNGKSGYFGEPTEDEFIMVAEHIESLLVEAGIPSRIERVDDGFSIKMS